MGRTDTSPIILVLVGAASVFGPVPPGVTAFVVSAFVAFAVGCLAARWVDRASTRG